VSPVRAAVVARRRHEDEIVEGRDEISRLAGTVNNLLETLQRTDTSVRESEQRFRILADSAPVLIWMSDPEGSFTYFNRSWLNFTSRMVQDELGIGWMEGIHPEDKARCLRAHATAFGARTPFSIESRLRRGDGKYRWILVSGAPRFSPDGRRVAVTIGGSSQRLLGDLWTTTINGSEPGTLARGRLVRMIDRIVDGPWFALFVITCATLLPAAVIWFAMP